MASRILVISHNSFSDKRNNGKTLEALFSEFPKDSLAQLFFHIGDTPDWNYCTRYFRITDKDVLSLPHSHAIGNVLSRSESQNDSSNVQKVNKKFYKVKALIGDVGRDLIWTFGRWNSPQLIKWIRDFNPELIFFVGGKAKFSANVALSLSKKFNIPLVSYYTDDYLLSIRQDTLVGRFKYWRINQILSKVINSSTATYVISDYMAEEYKRTFNRTFKPIMNAVVIRNKTDYLYHSDLKISYFGGLHLNRWQMIVRLARLLPSNAHIDVYTSSNAIGNQIDKQFRENGVIYKGSLSGMDLENAMANSDILLHVESDDEPNRRFTRLAVSTKIPEYLISARPILGFGPQEVASMRILADNDIGYVIGSDDDDNKTQKKLSDFCSNFEWRKEIADKGYEYACSKFNRKDISNALLSDFIEIITSYNNNANRKVGKV